MSAPGSKRTERRRKPPLDLDEAKPVIEDPEVMARMRACFDLSEVAFEMQRQNLRRRHPNATDEEIDRLLAEWVLGGTGAKYGDSGSSVFRPRKRVSAPDESAERDAAE